MRVAMGFAQVLLLVGAISAILYGSFMYMHGSKHREIVLPHQKSHENILELVDNFVHEEIDDGARKYAHLEPVERPYQKVDERDLELPDLKTLKEKAGRVVCKESSQRIALLISGWLRRFVYRDSMSYFEGEEGFRRIFGSKGATGCIPPVDIYIVLLMGSIGVDAGINTAIKPPYGDGGFGVEEIEKYYYFHGANRINISFIAGPKMNGIVDEEVSHLRNSAPNGVLWQKRIELRHGVNGNAHLRKYIKRMYLRHSVFQRMRESKSYLPYNYSSVLYLPEDTMFLWMTPKGMLEKSLKISYDPQPVVMLDALCRKGPISDKVILSNRLAADVVFQKTYTSHLRALESWLDVRNNGKRLDTEDYEDFLRSLATTYMYLDITSKPKDIVDGFKHEKIVKKQRRFYRVDQRYVSRDSGPLRCLIRLYWHCGIHYMPSTRPERTDAMRDHKFVLCS